MRIAVSGSTGLVGSALLPLLVSRNHAPVRLVRSSPKNADEVRWDPETGVDDLQALDGVDAIVHLAGENIAGGRWTEERKARIKQSRVEGTRRISEAMIRLAHPPRVLVCASAIGYYGDRGDEVLTEESPAGRGFLPEVCQGWEAATESAAKAGIRVVNLRIGVVLSRSGGALAKMLTPFRMGVGGKIGSGEQYMSWIALEDLVAAICHAITVDSLAGPVNAVSTRPVTNLEFTKALGKALSRPTIFPMPAFAARLALGEMADALLLSSQRVQPVRLTATGFQFRFTEIEPALEAILSNSGS